MSRVSCFVPDHLLFDGEYDPDNPRESYRFIFPSMTVRALEYPMDEWPVVEIPADAIEWDGDRFPPVDGEAVDSDAMDCQFGKTGLISLDTNTMLDLKYPNGDVEQVSCHDLMAGFTGYMETYFRISTGVDRDDVAERAIYRSCHHDYQDESPHVRIARAMRIGIAPFDSKPLYENLRVSRRDYTGLPSESGYVGLNHTMLRKDLISPDLADINGVSCRKVFVPSIDNFISLGLDDMSGYTPVYIPESYFWNVDAGMFDSSSGHAVSDLYAVCSIPSDGVIYGFDGSPSGMDVNDFSARLTCLTSCQVCHDNLLFDSERFAELYNRISTISSGGARWNQIEMSTGVAAVDFVKNRDGQFEPIGAEERVAVKARADDYRNKQRAMQARSSAPSSKHSQILSAHVGRDYFKSRFVAAAMNFDVSRAGKYEDESGAEELAQPPIELDGYEAGGLPVEFDGYEAGEPPMDVEPGDDVIPPVPYAGVVSELDEPVKNSPPSRDMSDIDRAVVSIDNAGNAHYSYGFDGIDPDMDVSFGFGE